VIQQRKVKIEKSNADRRLTNNINKAHVFKLFFFLTNERICMEKKKKKKKNGGKKFIKIGFKDTRVEETCKRISRLLKANIISTSL
jgi:hypothetical protein